MPMPPIPATWEPTRLALQRYSQAVSALPRAGAPSDPRWSHVSLHPTSFEGRTVFASTPTPLPDGRSLVSMLDASRHRIVVAVGGDHTEVFDLTAGPSPLAIGSAVLEISAAHGASVDVERSRFDDDRPQDYDLSCASAWHANSEWVVETFAAFNQTRVGETAGPHLWPHGFDIATEWFGSRVVGEGPDAGNAQIALGFYPAGEPYFYVNPWPFEDRWAEAPLPGAARWHTDGWQGAMLPASELSGRDDRDQVLSFARAVHDLTGASLT